MELRKSINYVLNRMVKNSVRSTCCCFVFVGSESKSWYWYIERAVNKCARVLRCMVF